MTRRNYLKKNDSFFPVCFSCVLCVYGGEEEEEGGDLVFTFASLVVMGHLQTCSSESALDVEALVGVAAVEDAFVAANLFGDEIEGLDESEAELLALLVLGDGNILDVADFAQAVDAGEENEGLAAV